MPAAMWMRGSRGKLLATSLLATLCLAAVTCRPPALEPPETGPRLMVLIIVDQFRGDYLDRFSSLWTGGLRRLLDEGVVFADAHHRHSMTLTATGHATLATGCHPSRHGIISNYWVDTSPMGLPLC